MTQKVNCIYIYICILYYYIHLNIQEPSDMMMMTFTIKLLACLNACNINVTIIHRIIYALVQLLGKIVFSLV